MKTIGSRVRAAIIEGQRMQKDVASAVGMTPDALSRALSGQRGFGAAELAAIARCLDEDLHFLITGESGPPQLTMSARHSYDPLTRQRSAPAERDDRDALDTIALALRQADLNEESPQLPASAAEMATMLGPDFAGTFVDRLDALHIDVVRLEEVTTAYSFTTEGRHVIVIQSTGNWFYENWSLAHELGHLCLGHSGIVSGAPETDTAEAAANAFAAALLLPVRALEGVDHSVVESAMAELLWDRGVSTTVMRNRLNDLEREVPEEVRSMLETSTQKALRHHWRWRSGDPITDRMVAASSRRFPRAWIERHIESIAQRALHKDTLAWMLGVDPEALEVDEPVGPDPLDVSDLAGLIE